MWIILIIICWKELDIKKWTCEAYKKVFSAIFWSTDSGSELIFSLNHPFSFSPLLTYLSQASPCSLGLFNSEQEEPDKERNVEENAQIPVKLGPDLYQLMDSPLPQSLFRGKPMAAEGNDWPSAPEGKMASSSLPPLIFLPLPPLSPFLSAPAILYPYLNYARKDGGVSWKQHISSTCYPPVREKRIPPLA